MISHVLSRNADPHHFNADPDPDSAFHSDADPDPDRAPLQSDGKRRHYGNH